jgi:hypothetical protein
LYFSEVSTIFYVFYNLALFSGIYLTILGKEKKELENPSWLTGRKWPMTCYRGSAHSQKSAHGAEVAHALGGNTGVVTTRPSRAVARSSPARGWPWWPTAQEGPPV